VVKNRSAAWQIGLGILPIVVSLFISAILVIAVGADPRAVFVNIWEGAFRDSNAVGQVVNFWIPLTLASIGLIVTFTGGLWNIGVEGQITMGAVFASWAALTLPLPPLVLIPIEIAVAMLGGGLWAALCGLLKTRLGVHEIFGGVALNFLADAVSLALITGPWQPPEGGSARGTPNFKTDALLPPLSDGFKVNLLMLILVLIAVVAVVLALRGTRWGLQLKATGKNARSALLLGVPTRRSAMSAFIVCGALAGLAGSYRVLFTYARLLPSAAGGIGVLALLVVLLVSVRALWVPFVSFAFAAILAGSGRLRIALQLDASLAKTLQEVLVLTVLLFNGLRARLSRPYKTDAEEIQAAPVEKSVSASGGR